MREISVKQLATKVRDLKENKFSSILFLGAGVSRSAGMPLSDEIMTFLEENEPYKIYLEGCSEKSYTAYMSCLPPSDRKRLFNHYIKKARINASYLYAAQLVSEGYIDCVVTTNFDPLILRALSIFNIYPAVYDLTIAKDNISSGFEYPAVLFFHGQNNGFWQLNTEDEFQKVLGTIKNTIMKISNNRAWIVVGYKGADPVLDQLAGIDVFSEGLYWVCYKKEDPFPEVQTNLLNINTKGCKIIKGFDSDSFFRELKIELKLNDASFIQKPFSHLLNIIKDIKPMEIEGKEVDLCSVTKELIIKAIKGFEEKEGFDTPEVNKEVVEEGELLNKVISIYSNNKYEEVLPLVKLIENSKNNLTRMHGADIFTNWGISVIKSADNKDTVEKEKIIADGISKIKKAIEIDTQNDVAYTNLGWSLAELSKLKADDEKEKLLWESIEKRKEAIEINPQNDHALDGWGWASGELSRLKFGEEKEKLLLECIEKRRKASEINPGSETALDGWGWALGELSRLREGEERENLLLECIEKRRKVSEINPGNDSAMDGWGWALGELSILKQGEEKEKLLLECIEKRGKAAEINPSNEYALNGCAWALGELSALKQGLEKEDLMHRVIDIRKQISIVNPGNYFNIQELAEGLLVLNNFKEAEETLHKFSVTEYTAEDQQVIYFYFMSVLNIINGVTDQKINEKFNNLINKNPVVSWSFGLIDGWLKNSGIEEDKKKQIIQLTDKMKSLIL